MAAADSSNGLSGVVVVPFAFPWIFLSFAMPQAARPFVVLVGIAINTFVLLLLVNGSNQKGGQDGQRR